jgi:hypothetical protein
VFDRTQRKGLTGRIVDAAGLPRTFVGVAIAMPPAHACYPVRPDIEILPPIVDTSAARRLAETWLGGIAPDIDVLYRSLWGLSREQYFAAAPDPNDYG